MSIVSLATLKTYFETGDFPTENQFIDLIDTLSNSSTMLVKKITYSTADVIAMFGTPQLALPAPAAGYTNNIYGITHDLDKTTADSVASEMYYGRGVAGSFYAFFDFWSLQANADLNIPLAKTAGSSDSVFTTTKDL